MKVHRVINLPLFKNIKPKLAVVSVTLMKQIDLAMVDHSRRICRHTRVGNPIIALPVLPIELINPQFPVEAPSLMEAKQLVVKV